MLEKLDFNFREWITEEPEPELLVYSLPSRDKEASTVPNSNRHVMGLSDCIKESLVIKQTTVQPSELKPLLPSHSIFADIVDLVNRDIDPLLEAETKLHKLAVDTIERCWSRHKASQSKEEKISNLQQSGVAKLEPENTEERSFRRTKPPDVDFEFEEKESCFEGSKQDLDKLNDDTAKDNGTQTDEGWQDIELAKLDLTELKAYFEQAERDDSFKQAFKLFEYIRNKLDK